MIKLVRQEVKNIGHVKDYKGLERIGRICYRSENKITEDSYLKFIKMLLKNGHLSVLEHLNIILRIDHNCQFNDTFMFVSPYFQKTVLDQNSYIVSGSFRTFYEYCLQQEYFLFLKKIFSGLGAFDEIFINLKYENTRDKCWLEFMEFNLLSEDDIINFSCNPSELNLMMEKHIAHTFYVILNRGISHEYVRHRATHAITQESTRFIKYNEVEIILPEWFYEITDKNQELYNVWFNSCECDADVYKKLLDMGFSPQQARDNLPHSLKTSLFSTMNLWQWKHFFSLRMSERSHPLIQEIAKKINAYLKSEYPSVF